MSVTEKITAKAELLPLGEPVTVREFLPLGRRASVDQALARLVKKGVLSRAARGIYVRPKRNPYVGDILPDPAQIAEVVAGETGGHIQVHGAEAARCMGFSTQVPVRPIFYTSGPSRQFHLGKMEILLKHVSPRKLALAGRPAGIALTALWYLGRREVNARTIDQIRAHLTEEEFEVLLSAAPSMPGWMHDSLMDYMACRHA
jgi:hypothetical protein